MATLTVETLQSKRGLLIWLGCRFFSGDLPTEEEARSWGHCNSWQASGFVLQHIYIQQAGPPWLACHRKSFSLLPFGRCQHLEEKKKTKPQPTRRLWPSFTIIHFFGRRLNFQYTFLTFALGAMCVSLMSFVLDDQVEILMDFNGIVKKVHEGNELIACSSLPASLVVIQGQQGQAWKPWKLRGEEGRERKKRISRCFMSPILFGYAHNSKKDFQGCQTDVCLDFDPKDKVATFGRLLCRFPEGFSSMLRIQSDLFYVDSRE